jgi:thioesterase domain-containing protein/acyl carrier protein
MISSVTGAWLSPEQATDPAYWRRQFREPVRFSDALGTLLASGSRAVIEAGPGGALSALVRQHPSAAGHAVVTTSPSPSSTGQPRRALDALGEAWLAGVAIDWEQFRDGERRLRLALPTYCFERERHWIDAVPMSPARRPARPAIPTPPPAARTDARPRDPARNDVERALVACFHELFRTDAIGVHDDFFALGGDSLLAVRLVALVARHLDVRLGLKAVVEAPTIAELAERIGAQVASPAPAAAASSCVVRLQRGAVTPPVFFVHGGGGHAVFYRDLARAIDPDRTMIGFESRGIDGREPPHASVEDMASHYVELVRAANPDGPYLLVGSSLGGMIAYEMARLLSVAGHTVPLCALLDTPGPSYLPDPSSDDAEILGFFAGRAVAVSPAQLRGRPRDAQLQLLLDEARRTGGSLGFSDLAGGRLMMQIWRNNFEAMCRYSAPPWPDGELQYFVAAERDPFLPPHLELAWIGRCAVRVEVCPGDHVSMVMAPHAAALGAKIRGCLEARTRSLS